MSKKDFSIYRYSIEMANGEWYTRDYQFSSDTEARVKLFEWFMKQEEASSIILFRYKYADTCGPFTKIDSFTKPATIYF